MFGTLKKIHNGTHIDFLSIADSIGDGTKDDGISCPQACASQSALVNIRDYPPPFSLLEVLPSLSDESPEQIYIRVRVSRREVFCKFPARNDAKCAAQDQS